jgi:hypothetical protein
MLDDPIARLQRRASSWIPTYCRARQNFIVSLFDETGAVGGPGDSIVKVEDGRFVSSASR